jgi:hypothetical protein
MRNSVNILGKKYNIAKTLHLELSHKNLTDLQESIRSLSNLKIFIPKTLH